MWSFFRKAGWAFALSLTSVAPDVRGDEFDVWAGNGSWMHADRSSGKAEPGKDSPGRLHLKVVTGDILYFQMKGPFDEIVFENGADEQDKVWAAVKPPSGIPIPELKKLPADDPRRKFYAKPDSVLTAKRPSNLSPLIIVIEIKNLPADKPVFFACGNRTHMDNRMFGAIVLEKK